MNMKPILALAIALVGCATNDAIVDGSTRDGATRTDDGGSLHPDAAAPDTDTATRTDDGGSSPHPAAACPGEDPNTIVRAPEGDSICTGRANCSVTSGQPDHQGCPNTCSCLCIDGACWARQCTAIRCADSPQYR